MMVPDWETNFVYFSSLLPDQFPDFWRELSETLRTHNVPFDVVEGTQDIWVRDFMPIQVRKESEANTEAEKTFFLKFDYRPDYLINGYEHLITKDVVCDTLPFLKERIRSEIILDGGNVVASTERVILTEKVFRENKTKTKDAREKLAEQLLTLFGVMDCIFIPTEPDDIIGHSDGVVRFIDDSTVVVNDYSAVDPAYGKSLNQVLEKHGLQIHKIPYWIDPDDDASTEDDISSAVGNYVNFLRLKQCILVPQYGVDEDRHALDVLKELVPTVPVVPIPCRELARTGGAANCVSWPIQR